MQQVNWWTLSYDQYEQRFCNSTHYMDPVNANGYNSKNLWTPPLQFPQSARAQLDKRNLLNYVNGGYVLG